MRAKRAIAVAVVAMATISMPATASANGGAYLELDRTFYLVGAAARAVGYVTIPEAKTSLLSNGPFYAYALPGGASLVEGRPIPAGAVRLGTFTIVDEGKGAYELEVHFTMPSLESGEHTIELCNDPCTLAGFREPLSGSFIVVATALEAELLKENGQLTSKAFSLRRALKKAEHDAGELDARLADLVGANQELVTTNEELEAQLGAAADAASAARAQDERSVDPWMLATIVAVALLLAAVFVRRRRSPARAAVA